jgi:hypothetical protein
MFFPFPGLLGFCKRAGSGMATLEKRRGPSLVPKNVLKIRKILTYKRFGLDDFGQSYAKGHFW